jgi:ABC-type Fe3+-citrate transport system substrate-binding protein
MNLKITKTLAEIRNAEKEIHRHKQRLRTLKQRLVEEENAHIIAEVRTHLVKPEEFSNFLEILKQNLHKTEDKTLEKKTLDNEDFETKRLDNEFEVDQTLEDPED